MEIRIMDSLQEFSDAKNEYLRLIHDDENVTPFFTHHWLVSWWRAYESLYKFQVFCLYNNERLVGAIPIMFSKSSLGKLPLNKVSFLGGNWGIIDFPVKDEAEGWGKTFLSWLFKEKAKEWEVLELGPLNAFSNHTNTFLKALEIRKTPYKCHEISNPYLSLAVTWEQFLNQRSKNFRRTLKKKEKEAQGGSLFMNRRLINPTAKDLGDAIFEVSQKSWQGEQGVAVANTEEGKSFYKLLCAGNEEFSIDLSMLYSGDQCVAYLLGLLKGRIYYAFDTGFDPAYADYSPGLLIHLHVLKSLCEDKIDEFNFGYEHSYKERFMPLNHRALKIVVYRSHVMARFRDFVSGVRGVLNRFSQ